MTQAVEPVIVGIGETPVGKHPSESTSSLTARVATAALEDGRREWAEIDGLIVTEPVVGKFPRHALAIAEQLGISAQLKYADTVTMGGASAVLGVQRAVDAVRCGHATNVLIIAADTPRTGQPRAETVEYFARQRHPAWERPTGMLNVSAYALLADEYLRQYSLDRDALVAVPLMLRRNAEKNQNAAYRHALTADEAVESRMISEPLRLIECSPINDGAAAVLVADAPTGSDAALEVSGSGFSSDYDSISYKRGLSNQGPARSSAAAVADSGVRIADGDLLMVYDSYSIAMALQVEGIGVVEPGQSPSWFREGRFDVGGDLPVNPHGGLLSHGHCGGAAGMHHVTELVKQLRGTADNQVPIESGFGYLQAEGGIISANVTMCVHIRG